MFVESRWSVSDEKRTGISLVSLRDPETGYVVRTPLVRPGKRTAAETAWAGARFSRSADTAEEIFAEIHGAGVNAEAKLATLFRKYGHASVADMAQVMVFMENIPMHLALDWFYASRVNAGQERSTRFQDFGNSRLPELRLFLPLEFRSDPRLSELEKEYQGLGEVSIANYRKWVTTLTDRYTQFYKPDQDSEKHRGALEARVFDSARFFLLAGFPTSIAFQCSAREWSRLISRAKGGRLNVGRRLGEQVEELLAPSEEVAGYVPEVQSLIRHTEVSEKVQANLGELGIYLKAIPGFTEINGNDIANGVVEQTVDVLSGEVTVGEKLVTQYVMALHPDWKYEAVLEKVRGLTPDQQIRVSEIIFAGHSHLNIMTNLAEVSGTTAVYRMGLGEARDFDRQRGQGRFIPLLEVSGEYDRLLKSGFILPLYLTHVPEFDSEMEEFSQDLQRYYEAMLGFSEKLVSCFGENRGTEAVLNVIPLAHATTMVMHGDPKQEVYFSRLRSRPGGHINYRVLAWKRARQISEVDPLLAGIALQSSVPDPSSREEFFNRG